MLPFLLLIFLLSPLSQQAAARTLAGIHVIDTPLVRAAEAFAQAHSTPAIYKHVMRSWLFGTLLINADATLASSIDREAHAVATLLHDLGWDRTAPHSPFVSPNRRFEVDGAMAAREFLRLHPDGVNWSEARVQRVWDAIALHTERSIAYYKEADVQIVSRGIAADFAQGVEGVDPGAYEAVLRTFPRGDLKNAVNETLVWLCETKAVATYGEFELCLVVKQGAR